MEDYMYEENTYVDDNGASLTKNKHGREISGPSFDEWLNSTTRRNRGRNIAKENEYQRLKERKKELRRIEGEKKQKQWLLRKSRYDKALEAMYQVSVDRMIEEETWFELCVALAAVDMSMGVEMKPEPTNNSSKSKPSKRSQMSLYSHFLDYTKRNTSFTDVIISDKHAQKGTRGFRNMLDKVEKNDIKNHDDDGSSSSITKSVADSKPPTSTSWILPSLKYNFPQQRVNKSSKIKPLTNNMLLQNYLFKLETNSKWKAAQSTVVERLNWLQKGGKLDASGKIICSADSSENNGEGKDGEESKTNHKEESKSNDKSTEESKEANSNPSHSKSNNDNTKKGYIISDKVALFQIGLGRLQSWIEEDEDKSDALLKELDADKYKESLKVHAGWLNRKNILRIKMPPSDFAPSKSYKPPPMVFGKNPTKGPVVAKKARPFSNTVETLMNSGLRYVHATGKSFYGSDIEDSREALEKMGYVAKSNFVDEDGSVEIEKYYESKAKVNRQKSTSSKKKRKTDEDELKNDPASFDNWLNNKNTRKKAVKYLNAIDAPTRIGLETTDEKQWMYDLWTEVGLALKGIDRSLVSEWSEWSKDFKTMKACQLEWESFPPKSHRDDDYNFSSSIKNTFLKLLYKNDISLQEAVENAFLKKCNRQAIRNGEDPPREEEVQEWINEKTIELTAREFRKMLVGEGVVMNPADIRRLFNVFDTTGTGTLNMNEVLQFTNESRVSIRSNTGTNEDRKEKLDILFDLAQANLSDAKQAEIRSNGSVPLPPVFHLGCIPNKSEISQEASLLLQWGPTNGSQPVAFYIVEMSGPAGSKAQLTNDYREILRDPPGADTDSTPSSEYLLEDLQPNTSYSFRIRCYNGHGASPAVHAVFTTPPNAPVPPKSMKVTENLITLNWNKQHTLVLKMMKLWKRFQNINLYNNNKNTGSISKEYFCDSIDTDEDLSFFLRKCRGSDYGISKLPASIIINKQLGGVVNDESDEEYQEDFHSHKNIHNMESKSPMKFSVLDCLELSDQHNLLSWKEFIEMFHSRNAKILGSSLESGVSQLEALKSISGASQGTKYILQQCVHDSNEEYCKIFSGAGMTYTVSGLKSGTAYKFRVCSVNCNGITSPFSAPVIISTLLSTPDTPIIASSGVLGTVSFDAVHLMWDTDSKRKKLKTTSGKPVDTVLAEWAKVDLSVLNEGSVVDLKKTFENYDVDHTGYLERNELKLLMKDLCLPTDRRSVSEALNYLDEDGSGEISFREFSRWYNRDEITYELKRTTGFNHLSNVSSHSLTRGGAGSTSYNSTALSSSFNTNNNNNNNNNRSDIYAIEAYRGTKNTCIVKSLEPNTMYKFKLRSISGKSISRFSKPVHVWTAPVAPTIPTAIEVESRSLRLKWHAGLGGAFKYCVEIFLVDVINRPNTSVTLAHSSSPLRTSGSSSSRQHRPHTSGGSGRWEQVWDGKDNVAFITGLNPASLYRMRVFAYNVEGNKSEASTIAQVSTLPKGTSTELRPNNANNFFNVECTGDVVTGDVVLFTERLYELQDGRVVTEREKEVLLKKKKKKKTSKSSCNASTYVDDSDNHGDNGSPTSESGEVMLQLSLGAHRERSTTNIKFLAERTIAGRAVAEKVETRSSSLSHGSTSASSKASVFLMQNDDDASTIHSRVTWRNRHIGFEVLWSTVSSKFASKQLLPIGIKIWRRERDLFKFETFRRRWLHEENRWTEEEEQRVVMDMEDANDEFE